MKSEEDLRAQMGVTSCVCKVLKRGRVSRGICRKPPLQKKGIFKIFRYLLICAKEIQKR